MIHKPMYYLKINKKKINFKTMYYLENELYLVYNFYISNLIICRLD